MAATTTYDSDQSHELSDVSDEMDSTKQISLVSFGNRYSAPKNTDLVISVAHFENPPRELRAKMTGLSSRLQSEFYGHPSFEDNYSEVMSEVIEFLKTNKSKNPNVVMVAIGCEEGKHRSVAIIEKLKLDLNNQYDENLYESIVVSHRDIDHKQKQITQKKQYDKRRQEKRGQCFQDED